MENQNIYVRICFDFPHFEKLEINLNESAIKEIKENMSNLINLHEEMRKVIKKRIRE
ncbi:hypothetical protein P5763_18840 [Bacillus cereus]|uniref:hypothetical protein n=1 Tax=Bacillus cereus TaxID=1396 RepID=UPI0015906AF0|nr:hypothetical protein [Bacillus cereus]MDF9614105.1 hypothetical protein [Bacillus cereus]